MGKFDKRQEVERVQNMETAKAVEVAAKVPTVRFIVAQGRAISARRGMILAGQEITEKDGVEIDRLCDEGALLKIEE
jgi:hypothetical protein